MSMLLAKAHNSTDPTAPAALTVPEAARYLRMSRANIYRLFKSGDLKPARIGGRTLVRRVDADALLDRAVEALTA